MEAPSGPHGSSIRGPAPGTPRLAEEELSVSAGDTSAAHQGMAQRSADKLYVSDDAGGAEAAGQEWREGPEEGAGGYSNEEGMHILSSSLASRDDEGRGKPFRRAPAARADASGKGQRGLLSAAEPAAYFVPDRAAGGSAGKGAERPQQRGQSTLALALRPLLPRGGRVCSCSILLVVLLLLVLRLELERGTLAGISLPAHSFNMIHPYIARGLLDGGPGIASLSSPLEDAGHTGQQLEAGGGVTGAGAEGPRGGEEGGAGSAQQEDTTAASQKGDMAGPDEASVRDGIASGEIGPTGGAAVTDAAAVGPWNETAAAATAQPQNASPAGSNGAASGKKPSKGGAPSLGSSSNPRASSPPRYVWAPREGKFLLVFCVRGQVSNRMLCMRNHVIAAALLNRTLVVPLVLPPALVRNPLLERLEPKWSRTPRGPGYYTSIVWDIGLTRACLGPSTVITEREYYKTRYYAAHRQPLLVDVVHCWSGPPETCGSHGATNTSDSAHLHNCPWSFGDPVQKFAKKTGKGSPKRRAALEEPRVSQWHIPRDSYLAPFMYPDLADAQGKRQGPTRAGPGVSAASRSGQTPGAASDEQAAGGRPGEPRLQHSCLASSMSSRDFIAALGQVEDPVLVIGDMVTVRFTDAPQILPGAVLTAGAAAERDTIFAKDADGASTQSGRSLPKALRQHFCKDPLALLPAEELITASEKAKVAILGAAPYLGIHWRRGDFGVYCFYNSPYPNACFYSPAQAGRCAIQTAQSVGLKKVFLATNAPEPEVRGFRLKARARGGLGVVQLPPSVTDGVHKNLWHALLRRGLVADGQQGASAGTIPAWSTQRTLVGLTLEKLVAARSQVFLGSVESTFTKGIEQIRMGLGARNPRDSYLCFRQLEWAQFEGLPKELIPEKKRRLKREKFLRTMEAKAKHRQKQEERGRKKKKRPSTGDK